MEIVEVSRVTNSKDANQWRLQCIVQSNIEVMRNVMQMHSHAREMMFEIVGEVARRGLKGGKMVVSEGIELKFNQEELREIVNDFLTQPELVEKHRHLLLVIQASLERNEASTIKYQFKIDKSSQQAIRLERLGLPLYVKLDPTDQ